MWISKDVSEHGWCNLWRTEPVAIIPTDGGKIFISEDPTEISTTIYDKQVAYALISRELKPGESAEFVSTEVIG